MDAITKAPAPTNVVQLQSFLGSINFYRKFLRNFSTIVEPLTRLLKSEQKWVWGFQQQQAFQNAKEFLLSSQVLVHYNPKLLIVVSANSSSYGIGAVLSHTIDGVDRPVLFASRSLTASERNYSQLDKEALALIFALKKFHFYIYGTKFRLVTDHKPLLGIFSADKCIPVMASGRIQRWALMMQAYKFDLVHTSGKNLGPADALSRLPVGTIPNESIPVPAEWVNLVEFLESTPINAKLIAKWTATDPILSRVFNCCKDGWPATVDTNLLPFKNRHLELSLQNGCILWSNRVVIPSKARAQLLNELHAEHMGSTKMKELARGYFWWPGLDSDIESLSKSCSTCLENRNMPPKSPLHPWDWPNIPWYRIHVDYAGPMNGMYYLVVVDAHSKWVEIFPTSTINSNTTISILRSCFARLGLPVVLVSDNATNFASSEFKDFMSLNGIRHIFSAPFKPSTNGLAENMVKTFKAAMAKFKRGRSGLIWKSSFLNIGLLLIVL